MKHRYWVGVYVNSIKSQAAPILIHKISENLSLEEAEALATAKNVQAGHTCTDLELKLKSPTDRFFMYDWTE